MPDILALTGNEAAAWGVRLSRAQVVVAYPITPQTTIVETIAKFVADGWPCEFVNAEGEHGMASIARGAEAAGARTYFCTSSQGFAYAIESICYAAGERLPIVMSVVNRPIAAPATIWCDYKDSMLGRDIGWLQLYCEHNQEVLDTMIQCFKIAEDPRVTLPVMECHDGFYVSHTSEPVEVPHQEEVDEFLPPYKPKVALDPMKPLSPYGGSGAEAKMAQAWLMEEAMRNALGVIEEANEEFGKRFGRSYGNGLIEKYRCEDADAYLVTMGSMTGTARMAIDELREKGKPIGLVRLKTFRPFPIEEFRELAKEVKAIGVVDRCIMHGTREGGALTSVKSALYNAEERPLLLGFVVGLFGSDISLQDIRDIAVETLKVAETGRVEKEVQWVPTMDVEEYVPKPIDIEKYSKMTYPGSTSCPGCGMALAFRTEFEVLGPNLVATRSASCGGWTGSMPNHTLIRAPIIMGPLPAGAATGTGISRGLKALGKTDVVVMNYSGDGSAGDMGFMATSGAAYRNEDMIQIIHDNEAYMNTGIQRSHSTPFGAWTTSTEIGKTGRGNPKFKKELARIIALHGVSYAATATIAHMRDFRNKLEKAKGMKGFRFIQVMCPCPTGWRFPTDQSIEVCRLAVNTGVWPLFEVDHGRFRITYKPKERLPVASYLKTQNRFRHMTDDMIKEMQQHIDQRWEEYQELDQLGAV
ncbi:MAG: thiamine pyrophosphate-dependent enzyme [Candidatus Bathyarchaeia archaeon]